MTPVRATPNMPRPDLPPLIYFEADLATPFERGIFAGPPRVCDLLQHPICRVPWGRRPRPAGGVEADSAIGDVSTAMNDEPIKRHRLRLKPIYRPAFEAGRLSGACASISFQSPSAIPSRLGSAAPI